MNANFFLQRQADRVLDFCYLYVFFISEKALNNNFLSYFSRSTIFDGSTIQWIKNCPEHFDCTCNMVVYHFNVN